MKYKPLLANQSHLIASKQKKLACLVFSILGITMTLSGCSSFSGTPKAILDVDTVVESLLPTEMDDEQTVTNKEQNSKKQEGQLERWARKPPLSCDDVRDAVNKVMTAMDLRYAEFIDDISVENKTKATVTDITLTGLGLAGTAVGGAGAKTVFNALSAGLAAANTSIDKNFFYEKTIPALIAKMNADRKSQQLFIIQRLKGCKKQGEYLWFEAVHDLTDYYSAGTLLGAIASISKDAGVSQDLSEEEIKDTLVSFTASKDTDVKARLRQLFRRPGGTEQIMTCWRQVNPAIFKENRSADLPCAGGTPSPARLINAAECAGDQTKVLQCIEMM